MLNGFAYCRMLFNKSGKPVGFVYLDVNDVFEKLTGLKRTAVVGKNVTEVIPGINEQNPEVVETYGRVVLTGKPESFEVDFKPLGIWLMISVYRPEKGHFVAVFENITERKRTEQTLRDSEQRFRLLFEMCNDGAMLHGMSADGKPTPFVEVNEAICQRMGYSREEFQHLTPLDIDDPSENINRIQTTDKFVRNGKIVFERTHIAKNGRRIPVEISSRMLEIEGKSYALSMVRDISERKRMEQALRESEQRFRLLFNLSNDAAMFHEIGPRGTGSFIEVNDAACRMLGYTREELLKLTPWDIDAEIAGRDGIHIKPDNNGRVVFESTHVAKNGKLIPVEISSRIFEIDGKRHAISLARDITERKAATQRLEQAVADKTAQLAGANCQLREEITQRRHTEENLATAYRFLEIGNRNTGTDGLLRDYVKEIQDLTRCSGVAIRLLDKSDKIPYQATAGFPDAFLKSEGPLSIRFDHCMCINVIKGITDPARPFYTQGGSFYLNATTRFLATVPEAEKEVTRNVCNAAGYESVALIPIRASSGIIGLIHLADEHEDMVPLALVEQFENLAVQMGIAIDRAWLTEALRTREEHFRTLYEKMPVGYQSLDGEGRFLNVNPAWLDMLGFGREEVIGRWFGDFIVPEQVPLFKERFPRFKERGESETEFTMVRKNGSQVLVAVTGRIDYDQQGKFKRPTA